MAAGPTRKSLRTEVATLKARIAELQSALDEAVRRGGGGTASVAPGWLPAGGAGGLCADPCPWGESAGMPCVRPGPAGPAPGR